jgi:hypothetical protein
MYANAQYIKNIAGEIGCISIEINGALSFVPLDPANTDYANIMQLVAEGKLTIAPAE